MKNDNIALQYKKANCLLNYYMVNPHRSTEGYTLILRQLYKLYQVIISFWGLFSRRVSNLEFYL